VAVFFAGAFLAGALLVAGCCLSFRHRNLCAAAIRFRALALIVRLGFAAAALEAGCDAPEFCRIFFHRNF
jgi:hypothetical protein